MFGQEFCTTSNKDKHFSPDLSLFHLLLNQLPEGWGGGRLGKAGNLEVPLVADSFRKNLSF